MSPPKRPFTTSSLTSTLKSTIANSQPLLGNLTNIDKLSSQASSLAQKTPFFNLHNNNTNQSNTKNEQNSNESTTSRVMMNSQSRGTPVHGTGASRSHGPDAPNVDMSHLTEEERLMIQSVMAKAEMADRGMPVDTSAPSETNMPSNTSQTLSQQSIMARQQNQIQQQQQQQTNQVNQQLFQQQSNQQPQFKSQNHNSQIQTNNTMLSNYQTDGQNQVQQQDHLHQQQLLHQQQQQQQLQQHQQQNHQQQQQRQLQEQQQQIQSSNQPQHQNNFNQIQPVQSTQTLTNFQNSNPNQGLQVTNQNQLDMNFNLNNNQSQLTQQILPNSQGIIQTNSHVNLVNQPQTNFVYNDQQQQQLVPVKIEPTNQMQSLNEQTQQLIASINCQFDLPSSPSIQNQQLQQLQQQENKSNINYQGQQLQQQHQQQQLAEASSVPNSQNFGIQNQNQIGQQSLLMQQQGRILSHPGHITQEQISPQVQDNIQSIPVEFSGQQIEIGKNILPSYNNNSLSQQHQQQQLPNQVAANQRYHNLVQERQLSMENPNIRPDLQQNQLILQQQVNYERQQNLIDMQNANLIENYDNSESYANVYNQQMKVQQNNNLQEIQNDMRANYSRNNFQNYPKQMTSQQSFNQDTYQNRHQHAEFKRHQTIDLSGNKSANRISDFSQRPNSSKHRDDIRNIESQERASPKAYSSKSKYSARQKSPQQNQHQQQQLHNSSLRQERRKANRSRGSAVSENYNYDDRATNSGSDYESGDEVSEEKQASDKVSDSTIHSEFVELNQGQSKAKEKNVEPTEEALKLLNDLKLTEQANQVMQQQQLLIKQSQELIRLQLEQQALSKELKKSLELNGTSQTTPSDNNNNNNNNKNYNNNHNQSDKGDKNSDKQDIDLDSKQVNTSDDQVRGRSVTSEAKRSEERMDLEIADELKAPKNSARAIMNEPVNNCNQDQVPPSGRRSVTRSVNEIQNKKRALANSSCQTVASSLTSKQHMHRDQFNSPTDTTDSDIEPFSQASSRRHQRNTALSSTSTSKSRITVRRREPTGLPPSPLPVAAAIQLHQIQQHQLRSQQENNVIKTNRANFLRSRSVTSSPNHLTGSDLVQSGYLTDNQFAKCNSPDTMSEFGGLRRRRRCPELPRNAVPMTPSMVRNIVQAQRVGLSLNNQINSLGSQSVSSQNAHNQRRLTFETSASHRAKLDSSLKSSYNVTGSDFTNYTKPTIRSPDHQLISKKALLPSTNFAVANSQDLQRASILKEPPSFSSLGTHDLDKIIGNPSNFYSLNAASRTDRFNGPSNQLFNTQSHIRSSSPYSSYLSHTKTPGYQYHEISAIDTSGRRSSEGETILTNRLSRNLYGLNQSRSGATELGYLDRTSRNLHLDHTTKHLQSIRPHSLTRETTIGSSNLNHNLSSSFHSTSLDMDNLDRNLNYTNFGSRYNSTRLVNNDDVLKQIHNPGIYSNSNFNDQFYAHNEINRSPMRWKDQANIRSMDHDDLAKARLHDNLSSHLRHHNSHINPQPIGHVNHMRHLSSDFTGSRAYEKKLAGPTSYPITDRYPYAPYSNQSNPDHLNQTHQSYKYDHTNQSLAHMENNLRPNPILSSITKDDIFNGGSKFESVGYRFKTGNQNKYVAQPRVSVLSPLSRYPLPYKRILLSKNPKDRIGNGIGISIVGGQQMPCLYDPINKSIITSGAFVDKVFQNSNVHVTGDMQSGDQIIEWNGVNLCNRSNEEVQQILLSQFSDDEVEIVYLPREKTMQVYGNSWSAMGAQMPTNNGFQLSGEFSNSHQQGQHIQTNSQFDTNHKTNGKISSLANIWYQ